jgi:hypothetical protein
MEQVVGVQFGNSYQLLGYTLHTHETDPGGEIEVTLYWLPLRTQERGLRPRVQIVNRSGTAAWGVSQRDFIGYNARPHTPEQFISETHTLRVFDDAPPYVGFLRIALVTSNGRPVRLADGSDFVTLPSSIRVRGSQPQARQTLNYTIADRLSLSCAAITRSGGMLHVRVYWRVIAPFERDDLTVFVHGLNLNGNLITQSDPPLFGGNYLPTEWLPWQSLIDEYSLDDAPEIRQIAIGVYTPEERLPVMSAGSPVPDNRILLELRRPVC